MPPLIRNFCMSTTPGTRSLTPDYYFSWDGRRESSFAASLLTKIKQIDRHAAVRQETLLWASFLRREGNLIRSAARPHSRLPRTPELRPRPRH